MGAGNVSYLVRLHLWNTRDVISKNNEVYSHPTPSLLLVVIAGVVTVIIGVLAAILLAS